MFTPARRNATIIPDVINALFTNDWNEPVRKLNFAQPALNILENEDQYKIEMAVPGLKKEDFNIKLNNDGDLVIAAEKKEAVVANASDMENVENKESLPAIKEKYLRRDFSFGKFSQTFSLPEDVDLNEIKANVADGILTVELQKKKPVPPTDNTRYIEVM